MKCSREAHNWLYRSDFGGFLKVNKSISKIGKEMWRRIRSATLVAKCKPASNKLGLEDVSKVVRTADTSWAYI